MNNPNRAEIGSKIFANSKFWKKFLRFFSVGISFIVLLYAAQTMAFTKIQEAQAIQGCTLTAPASYPQCGTGSGSCINSGSIDSSHTVMVTPQVNAGCSGIEYSCQDLGVKQGECGNNPPPVLPPACIPDGSCSAPTPPACGLITAGTDNCGNYCTKQGPACVPSPPLACISSGQCFAPDVCGTTTTGRDSCGKPCTKQGPACPSAPAPAPPVCTPNGSCSVQTPSACGQINQGVDNCNNVCIRQSAACPVSPPPPPPSTTTVYVPASVPPPIGGPITITNNPTNTNTSSSTSSSSSTANNTNNISFGNIGVGAPQPVAVVQPAVIQPQVVQPQVAGVTVTQLPKTGLPMLAWSVLAFIPAGFRMRGFRKIKKEMENDPQFLWEERQFKTGS